MSSYPLINGFIRQYAIGFVAESAEHDLAQLTRICERDPDLRCVLVDDGSTPDHTRLKTAVSRRRLNRDVLGRTLTCCELHFYVDDTETAEEVFARVSAALARHGWSADGGPA